MLISALAAEHAKSLARWSMTSRSAKAAGAASLFKISEAYVAAAPVVAVSRVLAGGAAAFVSSGC